MCGGRSGTGGTFLNDSLVSFFLMFLSTRCNIGGGVASGDSDMIEGDFVIMSGPKTSPCPLAASGLRCFGDLVLDLGSSPDKSSLAGFFFFPLGSDVPSMSSKACAFAGRPFAMAEFEVCWEIERGSLDLS
jgi:hypothetical protein